MRAIEVNIVLEDDDGKTYVWTYKVNDPATARRVEGAVRDAMWIESPAGSATMTQIGPVLRKVTEVEGRLVREYTDEVARIAAPRDQSGILRSTGIDEHLFPDGIAAQYDDEKDDYAGPMYRFHFTVEAVRVPDPEKDAQRLCGLPEKKEDHR